jgi:TrmH family RNA methyltransferase
MLTNKELAFLKSLQLKKSRDLEGQFLVDNPKVIAENLKSKYFKGLYVTEEASLKYREYWKNVDYITISNSELKKIAPSSTPQGAVAVFSFLPVKKFSYQAEAILLLDSIQDPGNVGTIIRSADWFGVKDVFLNLNCADIYNSKTVASSMGSIFNVNFYQNQDLIKLVQDLKKHDYQIIAADSHGQAGFETKSKTAIVIGSEAHGVSDQILNLSDLRYKIKGQGKAESLNAAVAAGIILYQLNK